MRRRAIVLCFLGACTAAPADPGAGAAMRIQGAQFYPGAMPAGDDAGPQVTSVYADRSMFVPGETKWKLSGTMSPNGNAAAIGVTGDLGYWIVVAGPPDNVQVPNEPTYNATVSWAEQLSGTYDIVVHAVDAAGHFGPPMDTMATSLDAPRVPDGMLVFTLRWDVPADLDLRVRPPEGDEIWKRNINSFTTPPPGHPPPPPGAWMTGGILDFDSNANCVIDDRDQEDVIWTMAPPSGHYQVLVDTFSLCKQPIARWTVEAFMNGVSIARATGTSTDADTRMNHDAGGGLLVLELDL
jgi:hypothetical protein